MKAEMTEHITWHVNSRGILESAPGRWDGNSSSAGPIPAFTQGCRESDGRPVGGWENEASLRVLDEKAEAERQPVILLPWELSKASFEAAEVGISLARHIGAQLVLCHALFPKVQSWVLEVLRKEAVQEMEAVLELAKAAGVNATGHIEVGKPAKVILKMARASSADLIVLAARKQGIGSRLFFGPRTNEQVVDQAECNVVVVRPA